MLFIELVAWPPGRYATTGNGRIWCDGVYIGQSVGPLVAAVSQWRTVLLRSHRVSIMIVVHPAGRGELELPPRASGGVEWVTADDACSAIEQRILRGRPTVSADMVAALIAATAEPV